MSEFIKFRASQERQERYKARALASGKTLSEWVIGLCDEDCVDTKPLDAVSTAEGFASDVYTKQKIPDGITMSLRAAKALRNERMQKAKK